MIAGITIALAVALHSLSPSSPSDEATAKTGPLQRRYRLGESIQYTMTGKHESRGTTFAYRAEAVAEVKQDEQGAFFEELRWNRLESGGKNIALPAESLSFRQVLSLDPRAGLPMPDIRKLDPLLIGPVFDLMTFYADLRVAFGQPRLRQPGDHAYIEHGKANSWANQQSGVLIGEDAIDFAITLLKIDAQAGTATLRIQHLPPKKPRIALPAAWMKTPVADTPNNWVQVTRSGANRFTAAVGKETFDVEIQVELATGKMLAASMDNPVETLERQCPDKELTQGPEPVRVKIVRHVEVKSVR